MATISINDPGWTTESSVRGRPADRDWRHTLQARSSFPKIMLRCNTKLTQSRCWNHESSSEIRFRTSLCPKLCASLRKWRLIALRSSSWLAAISITV